MNEYQTAAAHDPSARVAVVAAPGSGKSTTLTGAINYELSLGGGQDIVAISFTNAAADVMKARLSDPIRFCGTLHSYCLELVRKFQPDLEVMDEEEALTLLKETADSLRYRGTNVALMAALQTFWKRVHKLGSISEADRVVLAYVAELRRRGKADFDIILARAYSLLLTEKPSPVKFYVDEMQDSADVDIAIYERHPHVRIFGVGDIDQSIFSFRGANPRNMLKFYESASKHTLALNYRSLPPIVKAANKLIAHNAERVSFEMDAIRYAEVQPRPRCYLEASGSAQNFRVVELVASSIKAGVQPGEIAVLTRTNAEVMELSQALACAGIRAESRHTDEPRGSSVHVGTIHWSKGQEFESVVMANADEGLEYKPTEEDRRLFYVGMTRAKNRLDLVSASTRWLEYRGMVPRRVSQFVTEAQIPFIHEPAQRSD